MSEAPLAATAVGDPGRLTAPVEIVGRLLEASNAVFFGRSGEIPVVYKPVRGERDLWDFPDGCLAHRERAAYLLDAAAGFSVVPPTVLIDGPLGTGAVQWWVTDPADLLPDDEEEDLDDLADLDDLTDLDDADELDDGEAGEEIDEVDETGLQDDPPLFLLLPPDEVTPGWLPVFTGELSDGRPVTLAHADTPELRSVSVLDAILNNSDRKGSHLLRGVDGHLWGIDHGVSLHEDPKLRTVLWGWAGQAIPPGDLERVRRLADRLEGEGPLVSQLRELLTAAEVDALRDRVGRLAREGTHPLPQPGWPSVPWPAL